MSLKQALLTRSNSQCELCSSTESLDLYEIPPVNKVDENSALMLCTNCQTQIANPNQLDANHWRCLSGSMWSEHQPVQVMAFRMLSLLKDEMWAQDLLSQLYLEDSVLLWAQAGLPSADEVDNSPATIDSNGTRLMEGDSVTLIKDLDVKGAGFTAKRGTLVRNISLLIILFI